MFIASFFIPEDYPSLEINGKIYNLELNSDISFINRKIHLIPEHTLISAEANDQGEFNFPKSAELKKGTYKLEIVEGKNVRNLGNVEIKTSFILI